MSKEVKKLDAECASKIRKSQVITRVSDVVRELVDNSIDSGARSLQISLENFGLKKIEVKDSGHGIPAADVSLIFRGGYTSKLSDESHLSCNDQYGFRGEALSAICSFSGLTVVTKTQDDPGAKRYVLDKHGNIVSESPVALPNGTVVTIRELFSDYPVRQKHSSELKVCRTELKEIESYLKSVSIANPSVYMALYHNGNLIWSKPSVKNTEQAITTVFGIALARKLSMCPKVEFVPEENTDQQASWKGSLELFVPQAPVDMKSVGYTSNKMTMIFVNRRRVTIDDYEKLIKRYAIGAANNPTQPDQRKYPAAVLIIDLPPTEVDFNRDLNKSKLFLCCHDLILSHLEEMLQSFYGFDLNFLSPSQLQSVNLPTTGEVETGLENSGFDITESDMNESVVSDDCASSPLDKKAIKVLNPPSSTPEKRKENVMSFLGDLSKSSNFSKCSPNKKGISPSTSGSNSHAIKVFSSEPRTLVTDFGADNRTYNPSQTVDQPLPVADFTVSDELLTDIDCTLSSISSAEAVGLDVAVGDNTASAQNVEKNLGSDAAKQTRQHNFLVPSSIPKPSLEAVTSDSNTAPFAPPTSKYILSGFSKPSVVDDEFLRCGAILHTGNPETSFMGRVSFRSPGSYTPLAKKPKLFDSPTVNYSPNAEGGGRKHRQVTLESLKNWNAPPKPYSDTSSKSTLRLPKLNHSLNVSLEEAEIDDTLIPNTLAYLKTKSSETLKKSYVEDSGLLDLTATVSLKSLRTPKPAQKMELLSQQDSSTITVINQLPNTRYYIVKVDGLLGVFDPHAVLVLRPQLEFQLESNYTPTGDNSNDCISFLLNEFTKFSNLLDLQSAAKVFQVLADLETFGESNSYLTFPQQLTST